MTELKEKTVEELRKMASRKKVEGRSKMNKAELIKALKKVTSVKKKTVKKIKGGAPTRFYSWGLQPMTPENLASLQDLITRGKAIVIPGNAESRRNNGSYEEIYESYSYRGWETGKLVWKLDSIEYEQGDNTKFIIRIHCDNYKTHAYLKDLGLGKDIRSNTPGIEGREYRPNTFRFSIPCDDVKFIRFRGIFIISDQFEMSRGIRSRKQWMNRVSYEVDPYIE